MSHLLQDGMALGNGVVPPPPFPENLAELMNSGTAPNVTLQVSKILTISPPFTKVAACFSEHDTLSSLVRTELNIEKDQT